MLQMPASRCLTFAFFSSCFESRRFTLLWQSLIYRGPHWDMLAWVTREPASGNAVDRSSSSASHPGTQARTSVLSLPLIDFVARLARRTFASFLTTVGCVAVAPLHSQSLPVKGRAGWSALCWALPWSLLISVSVWPMPRELCIMWAPPRPPCVRLSLGMQTFRRTC